VRAVCVRTCAARAFVPVRRARAPRGGRTSPKPCMCVCAGCVRRAMWRVGGGRGGERGAHRPRARRERGRAGGGGPARREESSVLSLARSRPPSTRPFSAPQVRRVPAPTPLPYFPSPSAASAPLSLSTGRVHAPACPLPACPAPSLEFSRRRPIVGQAAAATSCSCPTRVPAPPPQRPSPPPLRGTKGTFLANGPLSARSCAYPHSHAPPFPPTRTESQPSSLSSPSPPPALKHHG